MEIPHFVRDDMIMRWIGGEEMAIRKCNPQNDNLYSESPFLHPMCYSAMLSSRA